MTYEAENKRYELAAGHNVLCMVDAKLQQSDGFCPPPFVGFFFSLSKELIVVLLNTTSPVFSKPCNRADRPMGRRHRLEAGVSGVGTYAQMLCNMSGIARVVNGASMLGLSLLPQGT